MQDNADTLTFRVLDVLVDDEEALEELYLGCNLADEAQADSIFQNTRFRLSEIIERLVELEARGWITSRTYPGFTEASGIGGKVFGLTDEGRRTWERACPAAEELYD